MAIVISGVNNNDKITASDGTIDLLSGVNYAGIITAPAFTSTGNLSAASINVGSNIQVGNAGIITATTLIGNVTGNVNHTSNLLLQISGSEKLRIANSGAFGLNGTNYGSSGQVLTSQGSGSSPTWSTITGTTINSNAANRIITGSGSANTLEGNSNFTYTGSTVTHNNPSGLAKLDVKGSVGGGALGASISVRNTNSANNGSGEFQFQDPGSNIFAKIAGTNLTDGSNNGYMTFHTSSATSGLVERLRITDDGKLTLNYAATPPSEDVMICTAGQASPAGLTLSHLSGGNRYGARLQSISGTNRGIVISELFNSSYTDLAKVNTEFGLKADNTCKAWLLYRSEAGNEGIIDDFNVASVNDEGTGTFWVNLDRNIHRHGNGFSQAIVFGSYNASSYPFVASIGYAPSHGSYNPWWDVEDDGCRVQTQRSDTGAILDAKVFSLAMFGDTGDLSPT